MDEFIGRQRELELLNRLLGRAIGGGRAGAPRPSGPHPRAPAGFPSVFFTASGQPSVEADLALFTEAVLEPDVAMMEALAEYGRPFHQRATELVVPPLSPAGRG